jgi:hypothetical protein
VFKYLGRLFVMQQQGYPSHAGQSGKGTEVLGLDLPCAEGRECQSASLRSVLQGNGDVSDETQRYQLCHYDVVVAQLVALGFIKSV